MFPAFPRSILTSLLLTALCAAAASAAPFSTGVRYPLPLADNSSKALFRPQLRVLDDANGDGHRDLAVAMPRNSLWTFVSKPSRVYESRLTNTATTSVLASGDFNGNGSIDIVVGDATQSSIGRQTSFSLLYGSSDATFEWLSTVGLDVLGPNAYLADLVTGDFDGDTKLDVAVIDADPLNNLRNYANGSGGTVFYRNSIAVAYGRGNGQFDTSRPRIATIAYPQSLTTADFENDGRPELIVVGAESKTVQIASNSVARPLGSQYANVLLHAATENADIIDVATAYLNADNKLDLAILFYSQEPDAGRRYHLRTYLNTSTGAQPFAYTALLPTVDFDAAPGAIALANVTGDPNVDLIVSTRRADRPGLTIYPGDGTGGFGPADPLPERFSGEDVIAADLDSDTKVDLAVIDRSGHFLVVYWHL